MTKEAMHSETRNVLGKEVAQKSGRNHRFRVGYMVRTVGGSGAYNRGEIVEVVEEEEYYRVASQTAPRPRKVLRLSRLPVTNSRLLTGRGS